MKGRETYETLCRREKRREERRGERREKKVKKEESLLR